jgi:hypothetical protein
MAFISHLLTACRITVLSLTLLGCNVPLTCAEPKFESLQFTELACCGNSICVLGHHPSAIYPIFQEQFMTDRRSFLVSAAALAGAALAQPILGQVAGRKPLTRKERVDRALAGRNVDRPPFTHWHHFGPQTAEVHAKGDARLSLEVQDGHRKGNERLRISEASWELV